MATRSFIMDKVSNRGIYCHWDGYPDHHLPILTQFYNSQERVDALIELGDLSTLGICLVPGEHPEIKGLTTDTQAYHRDKDEPWDACKYSTNALLTAELCRDRSGCEYIYSWDGIEWKYKVSR